MIGNLIGASIGRRLAARNEGLKGALVGATMPWMIRRALTPIGLVALGAYGAWKLYDWRRERRAEG